MQVGVVNQEIEVPEEDTCPDKAWPDTLVQILDLHIIRSMQADVIHDRKASWRILWEWRIGGVLDRSDGEQAHWPVTLKQIHPGPRGICGDQEDGPPFIWAFSRQFVPLPPFLAIPGSESQGQGPEALRCEPTIHCFLFLFYPILQLHSWSDDMWCSLLFKWYNSILFVKELKETDVI